VRRSEEMNTAIMFSSETDLWSTPEDDGLYPLIELLVRKHKVKREEEERVEIEIREFKEVG